MRPVRQWLSAGVVAGTLAFVMPTFVAAQAKPKNATAQCKDGTYSTAKTERGACSQHGGVQTWYGESDTKGAKADAKAAGTATKEAAKDTGKAAKNAGKATADATKSAGKATKEGAQTAANAVKPKPSDAPADATAKCKDGSYSHAKQHKGACSGHGGVAEWYK
jgi:uncharacterized protein DUF3761